MSDQPPAPIASHCRRPPSARWPKPRNAGEAAAAHGEAAPKELQGPKGPEPTRYGDWERKGIASDF